MKRPMITAAVAMAAALAMSTAYAQVDPKLAQAKAQEHGCLTCHSLDTKKVGPAYKEVAVKYKGKTAAEMAAGMKAKPVHGAVLKKVDEAHLKMYTEWILSM
jgi:cytochrome c